MLRSQKGNDGWRRVLKRRGALVFPALGLLLLGLVAACSGGGDGATPGPQETPTALDPTATPTEPPAVYEPPHSRPGPSSDILRFRAFHTDVASAAVTGGDVDIYKFSLKTEAARALEDEPGVQLFRAPASTVGLVLNPAPAPEGELNPFSIPEVRFALQYAVNRDLIAQEIYKGLAKPMFAHLGPFDYDYRTVFEGIKELNTTYDPDLAKQLVAAAMEEAGAVTQDGVWHYQDRPIRLKFILRTEDERREIGNLVLADLQKLGFQVTPFFHEFGVAIFKVYATDPQLFDWHLYTEGWGRGSAQRYDAGMINQMCSPWLGNMPGWQEVGFWQYEHPRLDALGQRLFRGDFANEEERNQLYREATRLCQEDAVRIWLATVVNTFPATAELKGITEDLVSGPKSLWALREAYVPGQDILTVGSLWVWTERTTWNPVGGFGDIYSVDIFRNIHDPPLARHPFTGDPIPFRADYEVETEGPDGKLNVPSDAFLWDHNAGEFKLVGSGVKATSKVIFDYSGYFQSTWHHGAPISMADVLYSIFQNFDIAYDEEKSKIEPAIAITSRPYLETFRGFRVIDDNRLEVYIDFWHFVSDYIAEYSSVSSLTMPWEVMAAMDSLVFDQREAAYSDTAAFRYGVPWLSLVMPKDARTVRNTIRDFAETSFVPETVFQVGDASLVTVEEAQERYAAAMQWFEDNGMMVVSNGPFKLVRFDPPAQFAELEAVRDPSYVFKPGDWYKGRSSGVVISRVDLEDFTLGEAAMVMVELDGPGALGVRYVLFDPAVGEIVKRGDATDEADGTFRIDVTSSETSTLSPGLYRLFLLAFSDELALPTERGMDVQVRTP